ncbi:XtrA/YqaO family protein [Bacillus sp. CGMCC 1.16607]|uniref:XtrA/YqaO family protein n=1 Tax=Bacillus sp. CGMCC 1.16607 TaxID=3351842 RepID=UPI0036255514
MSRTRDLKVNINDMSIKQSIEPGVIKVIVLDGTRGTAKICEAVVHGETVIETHNGKTKKIHFRESELI